MKGQTMMLAELRTIASPSRRVERQDLEYIAFSGQSELAHGIFRSVPRNEWTQYETKYIFSEVIAGGIKKMRRQLASSAETAAHEEKLFLDDVVAAFIQASRKHGTYSRELFESLLMWADELTKLSLLNESDRIYDHVLTMDVKKFPDLYARCIIAKAGLLNLMGKFSETQSLLVSLAERPYIITDRNIVPELLFNLSKEFLQRGDPASYKKTLFRGLRHFYTNIENRRTFVQQIRKTYRRSHDLLFDGTVSLSDKTLYVIHRLYFGIQKFRWLKYVGALKAARLAVLGYVYGLNYVCGTAASREDFSAGGGVSKTRLLPRRRDMLITRAMGGIGDLLMMTPGIHALKRKFPHEQIVLAIPKRYFPIFQNNPDVTLVDIETEGFNHFGYKRWFNITDCPAARIESRTAPRVKKNRIELFARALGIRALRLRASAMKPRYFVSDEERMFQRSFWREQGLEGSPVIAVQLRADEVYRDYPHMEQLVKELARDHRVLVFDGERIDGFEFPNTVKVAGLPMRKAFALVAACDAIVCPDSSFVHLGAAFDKPTVALYGPIDGRVRTMNYPHCVYLDARKKLGCIPCWRNEKIPCKLTGMRTSVCMADIPIAEITSTVNSLLQRKNRERI